MLVRLVNHPVTDAEKRAWAAKGVDIIDARPTPPSEAPLTRQSIKEMSKDEAREMLEAHGVTDIPEKVSKRRALLKRVLFVDL